MKQKNTWKTNGQIRAPEVRVLFPEGKDSEVLPISEALKKAKELELDLVEIAPHAKPPVVKIIDFGKFRYQEEKKLKKQKTKSVDLKEVRLSPFIGDADYQTRLKRIDRFLHQGHKVRIVIVFKGRQMNSKTFGYELLEKVVDGVTHDVSVDMKPKFLGRHLAMIVSPLKKKQISKKIDNKDAKAKDQKISNKEV